MTVFFFLSKHTTTFAIGIFCQPGCPIALHSNRLSSFPKGCSFSMSLWGFLDPVNWSIIISGFVFNFSAIFSWLNLSNLLGSRLAVFSIAGLHPAKYLQNLIPCLHVIILCEILIHMAQNCACSSLYYVYYHCLPGTKWTSLLIWTQIPASGLMFFR